MIRHMTDSMRSHVCGGTITRHGSPDRAVEPRDYLLCERCDAFRYVDDDDEGLPSGTDPEANQRSWDNQDDASPEAAR